MEFEAIANRGLVLLGCGKMGSALLSGWLGRGLPPGAVRVLEPSPSEWLQRRAGEGMRVDSGLGDWAPEAGAKKPVAVIAVKPQAMGDALPALRVLGPGTLVVSIAAGATIATIEGILEFETPVVRAMPNTPAAIGRGITAIVGNAAATGADIDLADNLLAAVGQVVRLERESDMDAVTGVSGSGPAYVFHLVECLAAAGERMGLAKDVAQRLALATVAGAGALAEESESSPAQLRKDVTSPNGTTEAALHALMDPETGLGPLVERTVSAATRRSRELANG